MNAKVFFVLVGLLVILHFTGVGIGAGKKGKSEGGGDEVPTWLTEPLGGLLSPFGEDLELSSLDLGGNSLMKLELASRSVRLEKSNSANEEFTLVIRGKEGSRVRTAEVQLMPPTVGYEAIYRDNLDESDQEEEWQSYAPGLPPKKRVVRLAVREEGGQLRVRRKSKQAGQLVFKE